jgi:hypothetical protein
LGQFSSGSGDYTEQRGQWLDEFSLERIVAEIKGAKERLK